MNNFSYKTYGAKSSAHEVESMLRHLLQTSFESNKSGTPTPVCIWGKHGVGKTELVQDLAKELDCAFQYIAPAQFEEMGDLIGMPKIVEEADKTTTRFIPPEWVPTQEGPGILLIDDVNRADDRILRGIMQLLQNHELISWKLPSKWQIILTANPDGGDYSVTPMDDAMLTRMLHITLEFDLDSWLSWAENSGVDPKGITFATIYPEVFDGDRTTPRTLVQFFDQIRNIENPIENIPLIKTLGDACLDPETTAAFIAFLQMQLHLLPTPPEVLNSKNFSDIQKRFKLVIHREVERVDIIALSCRRLLKHLLSKKSKLTTLEKNNLKQFLLLEFIPNDLRLSLIKDLMKSGNPTYNELMAEPDLGNLLIENM